MMIANRQKAELQDGLELGCAFQTSLTILSWLKQIGYPLCQASEVEVCGRLSM